AAAADCQLAAWTDRSRDRRAPLRRADEPRWAVLRHKDRPRGDRGSRAARSERKVERRAAERVEAAPVATVLATVRQDRPRGLRAAGVAWAGSRRRGPEPLRTHLPRPAHNSWLRTPDKPLPTTGGALHAPLRTAQ